MNEYFISFYGCLCCRTTEECPNACGQKTLLYRCHLGSLTEQEIEYFKQKVEASGGFVSNQPWKDHYGYLIPRFALHSLNDIPLELSEIREEHIRAREAFEQLTDADDIWQMITRLRVIAWKIIDLRYGVSEAYFVDNRTLFCFFDIEETIQISFRRSEISEVRKRIRWMRRKQKKVAAALKHLLTEETRLISDCKDIRKYYKEKKLKFSQIAEPASVASRADTNNTEPSPHGRWLTSREFTQIAGVDIKTLADWRLKGKAAPDKNSGTDKNGNIWERDKCVQNKIRYWVRHEARPEN